MEDENSSLAPSDTISTRAKSHTATVTWAHTCEPRGEEPATRNNKHLLYCSYCETYSNPVTTNFRAHLCTHHGIHVTETSSSGNEVAEKLQHLYQNTTTESTTTLWRDLESVLDQDIISNTLTTLVICQNLAFHIMESSDFQMFCQALNPESGMYINFRIIYLLLSQAWCYSPLTRHFTL